MSVEGCWVKIYEDEKFEGRSYLLNGPIDYPNLKNLPGNDGDDFGDKIGSLRVGPKAWVKVFNDENYKDDAYTFGPDTEMPHLNDDDDIDSLKVSDQPL